MYQNGPKPTDNGLDDEASPIEATSTAATAPEQANASFRMPPNT
jgi:hypothetical protein